MIPNAFWMKQTVGCCF